MNITLNRPILQVANYYPFGMEMAENGYENVLEPENKFKYSGKELQDDLDLDWYDYGARMYDASVGRWMVIDPLAEAYNSTSPYTYVLNQPTQAIDPDGMTIMNDYHVDTKTGTVIEVETNSPDRIFVDGVLTYQGSYDGEYDGLFEVDQYYSSYSSFFNARFGDRLLSDNFFVQQLNAIHDDEIKAELFKARVRQAINTHGVEIVMYILDMYGTAITIGELTALLEGLGPVAKTFIKKAYKARADKTVLKKLLYEAENNPALKEISNKIDVMHENRRAMQWLKKEGLDYSDEVLKDILNQAEIDDMIKNLR